MRIVNLCVFGFITASSAAAAGSRDLVQAQPPIWSTKPDAAAFDKMENDRLEAAQGAIDKIAAAKGPRTIDNTLSNYDEAIRQINAAIYFSSLMEAVHPDAAFRDRATAMTRKASALQTELSLNRGVYQALAAIPLSHSDPSTQYYVQRQLLEFRLAGVDKSDKTRARLKVLNDDLTEEQSAFERNINDGQKTVEVRDASELAGLPADYIDGHPKDKDGVIRINTSYPDYRSSRTSE
jgi:thimet oligopeptidase